MNPIMMERMWRSEGDQRAREMAEIRLMNRAFPTKPNAQGGLLKSMRGTLAWLKGASRSDPSWLSEQQIGAAGPAPGSEMSH
jgi:hypothetical protein